MLFFIALKGDKLSIITEGDTKHKKGAKKNPIIIRIGWTVQNKMPVKNIIKAIVLTIKTLKILEYASFIEFIQFFLPLVAKSLNKIEERLNANIMRIK